MKWLASLLLLVLCTSVLPQANVQKWTQSVKLLFLGDVMGHDAQIIAAHDSSENTYNYNGSFQYFKSYFNSADAVIANLEVTLAGAPYKGYPQFSSPDALAQAAKDAGIDIMITANNHSLDRGKKGATRTLSVLDSMNYGYTGTFDSLPVRKRKYPLIFEINNISIALLNYTYGTNGIKVKAPFIVNYIDTALIKKDIAKAKSVSPDFIIVTLHWGKEYERTENKKQQQLAQFIFKEGADAIIGSHPHVIQPIDYNYDSVTRTYHQAIFYSLGNYVSNQRSQYKDGGIIAELELSKSNSKKAITDVKHMPYWVYRPTNSFGKHEFFVLPIPFYELKKEEFALSDNDIFRINRFTKDTRNHLKEFNESDFYK